MTTKKAENSKRKISEWALPVAVSLIAFVSMVYLFWAQSIKLNGLYYSDFMGHITRAIRNGGSGYSLEGKIVVLLNNLTDGNTVGISIVLAIMVIATPAAIAYMLSQVSQRDIRGDLSVKQKYWIGLWSIFTGPLVVPYLWNWFYKNTMNINAWHNSTYMEMRLFSVTALALYFRIQQYYLDQDKKIRFQDWLFLALSLLISTWFKPSFFIGFAPVMLLWLLIDFIRHRKEGRTIRKIVIFGLAAIPAGCMAILQYMKLYGFREDVSLAIKETQNVGLYLTRLGLFVLIPLIIYFFNRTTIKTEYKNGNRSYYQVLLLWAIEILMHFSLTEIGRNGGNFGWGARIGNFLLMVFSMRLFWLNIKHAWQARGRGSAIRTIERIYLWSVGILLTWQLGCGLYYYYLLMTGKDYLF